MKKLYLLILMIITVHLVEAQRELFITAPANIATTTSITNFSGSGWGANLQPGQTLSGEVVIGIDSTKTDSTLRLEGCVALQSAVRGKIALIRRGTCAFSTKTFNAQTKGAIAAICYVRAGEIPFSPDPGGEPINIPVAIISFDDAQKMVSEIGKGNTVRVTFRQPTMAAPTATYGYTVPLKEVQPLNLGNIAVSYGNSDATNQLGVVLTGVITSPSGKKDTVRVTLDTVRAGATRRGFLKPDFTPKEVGKHTIVFSNNRNNDIQRDSFVISEFMFANDKGGSSFSGTGTAVDSVIFSLSSLILDVGHIYYTGINPDRATHAMFALSNPRSFPRGDIFTVELFEFNNAVFAKLDDGSLTYSDLTALSAGKRNYTITGTELVNQPLFVEFTTPITLKDTSAYIVMVRYDGSQAGTGISPAYTVAGSFNNPFFYTDLVYSWFASERRNVFYSGWSGGIQNVVRLYMQGFRPPTGVNDLPAWAESDVTVFPNPVSNGTLSLNFDLKTLNKELDLTIIDLQGRVLKQTKLTNVQKGIQDINVSDIGTGQYFVKVVGKDGWRTKVFQVVK